jgi:hypothetical protein
MSTAIAPKKPVPPPAAVGAPAAGKKEKQPKEKAKKIDFPGLFINGDYHKLTALPTGLDAKLHKPLKKKDFQDEPLFLEYQATLLDEKAKSLRSQAEKLRSVGSTASSAKAKTLVKMQQRMAELMAQLKAEGMDVDTLLASK